MAAAQVYPGFVQLAAFMSMNIDRHVKAHQDLYDHIVKGEIEKAKAKKDFYDEYFAVLDLSGNSISKPCGWCFRSTRCRAANCTTGGRRSSPRAIKRTDAADGRGRARRHLRGGQTVAAHDLCSGLRPYLKRHHMQVGVGHYGVFSGKRWEGQIYPLVKNVILASD